MLPEHVPARTLGGCAQFALIAGLVAWFVVTLALGAAMLPGPTWIQPLIVGVAQLLVFVPVAMLARRNVIGSAAFGLGLVGGYAALVSSLALLSSAEDTSVRIGRAWILSLVVALDLGGLIYSRWRGIPFAASLREVGVLRPFNTRWLLFALVVAAPFVAPWAVLGALGSPGEMGLAILEVLGTVLGVEVLLRGYVQRAYEVNSQRRWSAILWSALAGGLLVLALGTWTPGAGPLASLAPVSTPTERLLVSLLPALGTMLTGLLLATVQQATGSYLPATLLVALLGRVSLPLFTDSRYLDQELVFLLLQAVLPVAAAVAALVLALLRRGLRAERERAPNHKLLRPAVTAVATWGIVGGLYIGLGSPGIYDDGLVVLLKEQTNLSGATGIVDRVERARFVYKQLTDTASRTQAPLRAELDRMGVQYRPYYIINMLRIDGHTDLLDQLAARPEVARVALNRNVRPYRYRIKQETLSLDNRAGITDSLTRIGVPETWALDVRGEGVLVAGADTGYDWQHPALQRAYAGWNGTTADHNYHWHDSWDDRAVPWDDDAHGTHTMGTMVGDDGKGNQTGLAPAARWIGCRNMRHGIGSLTSYAECLEFFLAPYPHGEDPFTAGDPARAPAVLNNSWGCPAIEGCWPDALRPAVEHLRAAGVMVVVSAGNDGPACSTVSDAPALYDAAFVVGATDAQGDATDFSSRGPATADGGALLKPDIAAPGDNIRSSVPGGGYSDASGTSMAGPHVVGLVALILSARPDLAGNIEGIEHIITSTARPRDIGNNDCTVGAGTQQPNNVYGYGDIDVLEAVRMALGR